MGFGIGGNANLEIADVFEAGDEIGGVVIPPRLRRKSLSANRGVAAQSDDVANPRLPVIPCNGIDLGPGRGNAGQMRGGIERGLVADAADRSMGTLTCRSAGAVGDRDKARRQWFEPLD